MYFKILFALLAVGFSFYAHANQQKIEGRVLVSKNQLKPISICEEIPSLKLETAIDSELLVGPKFL